MAHNCIDWTARPPVRRVPFLILSRGNDHVYTSVPKELKTLEDIARKEFDLGDADIKIFSSCVNLCNGEPARITESAWGDISSYIGCATVEVVVPRAVEAPPPQADEHVPLNADKEDESDRRHDSKPGASARESVPDGQGTTSDHGGDHNRAFTPENQYDEPKEGEEVSPASPRKRRHCRRVASEDDEGDESERERTTPAGSQGSTSASPPKLDEPSYKTIASGKKIKQERQSDYCSQTEAEQPDKPNKQEKPESWVASHAQPQAQFDIRSQSLAESSESQKLMIRVGHRPSKQESKFTTKSTTKVNKVLAGACKSFGLDASRATLYLIVSTEDEDGEVENLFPCDKNDTIARAGAEYGTESRFLLKVTEA